MMKMIKKELNQKNSSKKFKESSEGLGNTKQVPPRRNWCFTLHKYTEKDIQDIIDSSKSSNINYYFGEEKGKSGETPHLQGFLSWPKGKKGRPLNLFKNKTIHFEGMKGTVQQNIAYCSKEGGKIHTDLELPPPIKYLSLEQLYPYQKFIINLIDKNRQVSLDDRHIFWFVGEKNIGKSALLKLMCGKYKSYILPSTKRHALSQVQKSHNHINNYVFNLSADKSEYQTNEFFDILECLKDGLFSTSFGTDNNGMCITNDKIIIVMANKPPDYNKTEIDKKRIITFFITDVNEEPVLEEELDRIIEGENNYACA